MARRWIVALTAAILIVAGGLVLFVSLAALDAEAAAIAYTEVTYAIEQHVAATHQWPSSWNDLKGKKTRPMDNAVSDHEDIQRWQKYVSVNFSYLICNEPFSLAIPNPTVRVKKVRYLTGKTFEAALQETVQHACRNQSQSNGGNPAQ